MCFTLTGVVCMNSIVVGVGPICVYHIITIPVQLSNYHFLKYYIFLSGICMTLEYLGVTHTKHAGDGGRRDWGWGGPKNSNLALEYQGFNGF